MCGQNGKWYELTNDTLHCSSSFLSLITISFQMDQFVIEKTQPALQLDSLPSSHPISVKVDDPSEIESIFDTISYSKVSTSIYVINYITKYVHANNIGYV